MTDFKPTLTLSHPESGWDGTHDAMLTLMSEVLHDGPVSASVIYYNEPAGEYVSLIGEWVACAPGKTIGFKHGRVTFVIPIDLINSLSI